MHGKPRNEGLTRRIVLRGGVALGAAGLGGCLPDGSRILSLGTAETEGVYFQVGNAIAAVVNRDHRGHGVRCLPQSTPGSAANLKSLKDGLQLALIQGNDLWSVPAGDRSRLRLLAALHMESLILLVGPGIATLDDLPGQRVALGSPGSGHRTAMTALMTARGWTPGHFNGVHDDTTRSSLAAQCAGDIDAVPLMIGHPVAAVANAMERCGVHPLALTPADRLAFGGDDRGFEATIIPAGTYGHGSPELATVGTRVRLACPADLPDKLAALIVSAMLDDIDTLRQAHPVLGTLTPASLRPSANGPLALHDGAVSAYEDAGVEDAGVG